MADQSVCTVLSLSLHASPGTSCSQEGKPGVDLCPSVWCFNAIKPDKKQPILALPNLQEFTFTLLSSSTLSKPSFVLDLFPVSARIEDFLSDKNDPDFDSSAMKRKRQEISDPRPNETENHSHLTKASDVGVIKKQRVENPSTRRPLEGDGHWIKKRLSLSDVNDSSRLLLAKEDVRKYILPWMDEGRCAACQSTEGLRVKIWDLDTISEHELSLKQWKTGSFLLTSNWSMEFVKRRSLQEGDRIGLLWDFEKLGFFFHKFNAQS